MRIQAFALTCSAAILAIVLSAPVPALPVARRVLSEAEVNKLVNVYAAEGYEPAFLQAIFKDQRVRYVPNLVQLLVIPPDFSANYERFTTKTEINRACGFKTSRHSTLTAAAEASGVDPDIIVAILLIETSLGSNLGRSPVLSVFASLLLANTLHREAFAKILEGNSRKDHFLQRLNDKAAWAREQLSALLSMHVKDSIDICGLRGSYAGAFGIPQFLPTSYLKWASSGPEERSPDLFYMPHAIVSIANFLKEHGWRHELTDEEKRTVIWHYNRSSAYVDTVLAVAEKLKGSATR